MAVSTITIDGDSVVCPSEIQAFGQSIANQLLPIDGNAVVQMSNNTDSYGDKNAVRTLTWNAMPTSDAGWTHTVFTLKALEGTDVVLNATNKGGYTTTQNIRIYSVQVTRVGTDGTTDYWNVVLNYAHR